MNHHTPRSTGTPNGSMRELLSLFDSGDDEVTSPEIEIDVDIDVDVGIEIGEAPGPSLLVLPWAQAHTHPPPQVVTPLPSRRWGWLLAVSLGTLFAFGSSLDAQPLRARSIALSSVVDQDEVARRADLARPRVDEAGLLPLEPVVETAAPATSPARVTGAVPPSVAQAVRPAP